jgi:hypothetical protein
LDVQKSTELGLIPQRTAAGLYGLANGLRTHCESSANGTGQPVRRPNITSTEGVTMTTAEAAVGTAVAEPTAKARRRFRGWPARIVVAVVAVAAALGLAVWALTATTPTHTRPATTTLAPAPPVTGYVPFCQNNSDLCAAPAPAAPAPANPLAQFCQNNSDLCAAPAAPGTRDPAYTQFCQNNSDLCAVNKRE